MAVSEEDIQIDDEWLDMIKKMAKEDGATELTVYWDNGVMCYCAEWEGNTLQDQFINRKGESGEFDFDEDDAESYLEEHFYESEYYKEFTLSL